MSKTELDTLVFTNYNIPTYEEVVSAGIRVAISFVTEDIVKLLESNTVLSYVDMCRIVKLAEEFDEKEQKKIVYAIRELRKRSEYDYLWDNAKFRGIRDCGSLYAR